MVKAARQRQHAQCLVHMKCTTRHRWARTLSGILSVKGHARSSPWLLPSQCSCSALRWIVRSRTYRTNEHSNTASMHVQNERAQQTAIMCWGDPSPNGEPPCKKTLHPTGVVAASALLLCICEYMHEALNAGQTHYIMACVRTWTLTVANTSTLPSLPIPTHAATAHPFPSLPSPDTCSCASACLKC